MSNDPQAINQKGLVYVAHQFKQVQILKVLVAKFNSLQKEKLW